MKKYTATILMIASMVAFSSVANAAPYQFYQGGTGTSTAGVIGQILSVISGGNYQAVSPAGLGLAQLSDLTSYVLTSAFGGLFDNRLSATTTLPNLTTLANLSLPFSQTTGTVPVNRGGTNVATLPANQLVVGRGTNSVDSVGTTSASCKSGVSCSAFTVVGSVSPSITNSGVTSIVAGTNISISGATGAVTVNSTASGGSGSVATSTHETAGGLPYYTSNSGTPATVGQVGTTTLTATSPVSLSNPISVIGSTPSAITLGTVPETKGGTNQTTYATGDTLYASGVNTLSKLSASTNGFILALAGGIPSWVASTTLSTISGLLNLATQVTGTLGVAHGGTGLASLVQGWLGVNDSGAIVSSTSPTVAYVTATSTIQASTLPFASTTQITSTNNAYLATAGGNVAIGTSTAASKLDVSAAGTSATVTIEGNSTSVGSGITISDDLSPTSAYTMVLNPSGSSNANGATQPLTATVQTASGATGGINFIAKAAGAIVKFFVGGSAFTSEHQRITTAGTISDTFTASTTNTNTFPNASTTNMTTSGTASTTNQIVSGTLTINPLARSAGAFLASDPSGNVITTTTPSGGAGTVTSVTATAPLQSSGGATPNITYTGLATTSQPSTSQLLTSNGTNGVYGTATTSASCSSGVSCTSFPVLGSVNPAFTNTGVTSIVAGTNVTISGATGAVTINASGSGGGSGGFTIQTISGTIDGSNKTFTVPSSVTGSSTIDLNGSFYTEGAYYSVSGTTITYVTAPPADLSGKTHVLVSGSGSGGGSPYPFPLAGNATSSLTQFNGGLTALASTTIGGGTAKSGLFVNGSATTTKNVVIDPTNSLGGNNALLIGASTPTNYGSIAAFEVHESTPVSGSGILLSGGDGRNARIQFGGGADMDIGAHGQFDVFASDGNAAAAEFDTNGVITFWNSINVNNQGSFDGSGNLNINGSTGLTVPNGDGCFSAGCVNSLFSDQRLKTNLTVLDPQDSLTGLMGIHPMTGIYNSIYTAAFKGAATTTQDFLVAQDVARQYPECVSKSNSISSTTPYNTINMECLVARAYSAIKAQQFEISTASSTIAAQGALIQSLQTDVAALKAKVGI